jgi:hypothetical protein
VLAALFIQVGFLQQLFLLFPPLSSFEVWSICAMRIGSSLTALARSHFCYRYIVSYYLFGWVLDALVSLSSLMPTRTAAWGTNAAHPDSFRALSCSDLNSRYRTSFLKKTNNFCFMVIITHSAFRIKPTPTKARVGKHTWYLSRLHVLKIQNIFVSENKVGSKSESQTSVVAQRRVAIQRHARKSSCTMMREQHTASK